MCEQQTAAPHTAISTWSGFVYQGKIALYYCLKLIADDYSGNRGLKLQLESQDDFAVYNGQTCISMHQVKAYKSQNFSSYQIAFTAQQDKATSDGVSSAFFHVARNITDLPEEYETIYHPVKLYDYGTQQASKKYCSLEELDTLIETLLKSIISSEASLPNWKGNLSKLIREFLEAEINQKVIAIHHMIHTTQDSDRVIAQREFINFDRLYEILEADDFEAFETNDFFLSRLQSDIGYYYQQFCEQQVNLSAEKQAKLDRYIAHLTKLTVVEMEHFVKSVMPHRKGSFRTLRDYKDQALNADSMKKSLLTIFNTLITAGFKTQLTSPSIYWLHESNFYYPTGIHTAQEESEAVCYEILSQAISNDVEFLYENGSLVTRGMNVASIANVQFGPDAVEQTISSQQQNNILNYTRMSLVALDDVPMELKDD
ncbi:ABC-three component system protein [Shewanella algae]|uniref:ABC-three component system protein n=1 Tax=Shewanella algae TaxID=38313 RepID=UPI000C32C671|nr:ABC-three component system protein [Shewanella algae]MBO2600221.1 hypothetical protein [Shewanella algae]MBO2640813.1 hypothetical protein [Shewanella algae]PSS70877.1 hypothetical protein AYI85_00210 [Shewanella algae]TVL03549.1 hypothetical protein AYI84_10315 [Shewanella algae]TVL49840.1 hypothetical protein AYI99_21370 [Shewanella algae]